MQLVLFSGWPRYQKVDPSLPRWQQVQRGNHPVHTLAIILRLDTWALPFSFAMGSHVLDRGFTVGVGPVYFSWCRL